jgi:regulator of sigma E protease
MPPFLHLLALPLSWIAPFLVVMMTIVVIHELGHFLAARCFGVAIDRFSIGFGRALVSWRDKSGVEWRIGWAPIGGYVQFAGDENVASVPDQNDLEQMRADIVAREGPGAADKYLVFKPLWQRAVVAAAGPFANFILASVIVTGMLLTFGDEITPARIASVQAGSPAERAGIKPGDLVQSVAGQRVDGWDDLAKVIQLRANVPLQLAVRRGDQTLTLTATPVPLAETFPIVGKQVVGVIGVLPDQTAMVIRRHYSLGAAVEQGLVRPWQMVGTTFYYLGRLVQGQASFDQLGGPLRTAQLSHAIAKAGYQAGPRLSDRIIGVTAALLTTIAFISVSVGIFNLLPIPVLDGGHLAFYAYEAVARRPLNAAVQAMSYRVGLALLLGLMLFATTNDLRHSSVFHFLGGLFS